MPTDWKSKQVYGDATGPLGFPMPSEMASKLEGLLKTVPEHVQKFYPNGFCRKSVGLAVDLKDGERADVSLVTTASVDHDREVVLPGGGDWSFFRKNPVVTFSHNYQALPVGRALWVKRAKSENPTEDGWLAKTRYSSKPEGWEGNWFPDAVWHMTKEGDIRGKSIGFVINDMRPPEEKEIEKRPELVRARALITKWTALEYAVAPVQANPDALVQAVAKAKSAGFDIPQEVLEEMGLFLPEDLAPPKAKDPTKINVIREVEVRRAIKQALTQRMRQIPAMVREVLELERGVV